MRKTIAGATTVLLMAGLYMAADLPASAQNSYRYRQSRSNYQSRALGRSDSYMSQNADLMRRIDNAYRSGLISSTDATSLRDAVNQQARNYHEMRNSDGFLSPDELTALNTILNRTSNTLDNLTVGPGTRNFWD